MSDKIILVERHNITKFHKYFKEIDILSFKSKNLYNSANYLIRQDYFNKLKENNISFTSKYLNYCQIFHLIKESCEYQSLPRKVSNSILQVLDKNWKSFVKSVSMYYKEPSKFKSRPRIPRYKHIEKGRNILIYDKQALNKKYLKEGLIQLSGTNIKISTRINFELIKQIRILPKNKGYVIEIVYEKEVRKELIENNRVLSIDLGVNNLCTLTTNIRNQRPLIVNGRPLKSINQYYNKERAKFQSYIGDKGISNKIISLTNKRNNKVTDYLHKVSKKIIEYAKMLKIGKLIIGKNDGWKQGINIGSRNNQIFVNLPFNKLIEMLSYKGLLNNIEVVITEESYTSKCSFADNEKICKHGNYVGKRIKRGLFKSQCGKLINADVNGSYNILRKVISDFKYEIEAVAVQPLRMNLLTK